MRATGCRPLAAVAAVAAAQLSAAGIAGGSKTREYNGLLPLVVVSLPLALTAVWWS